MISCLTVTREEKQADLERALDCFHRQTVDDRELIIVHDGSARFHESVLEAAGRYESDEITVHRSTRAGMPLGALRNLSLSLARGDLMCQWDDDDLYHPARLAVQHRELVAAGVDFSFLTDQLHYFVPTGELFWDDWRIEGWPGSLIQGTIMGRLDRTVEYPDLRTGEDTRLVERLLDHGRRLTGIADRGYLYIYVFNGRNAFDLRHHAAISYWKRRRGQALLAREAELRCHLADYELPWENVFMPHDSGSIVIKTGGGAR